MASSFSSPMPVVFGLWPSVSPFTQSEQGSAPPVYSPPPFDLHAQYQALRPTLGERGAMPDPVHPELAPTLVAQAQAPPVPVNADGVVQAGYRLRIPVPAIPTPPTPPLPSLSTPRIPEWWRDLGLEFQLYLELSRRQILHNETADRPPAGSRGIDQTPWSGDHKQIKNAVGAQAPDSVRISPDGDVWAENPDGTWTNHGPAGNFTGSGNASGRRGKDRERW